MANPRSQSGRTDGWMGIHRGHRASPFEWLAEKLILFVSLSSIVSIFLIFLFVAREAFPVVLGRVSSAAAQEQRAIPVEQLDSLKPAELQQYLGLTPKQFNALDREALKALMEVKIEAAQDAPVDEASRINTVEWRYLLRPYQWSGYSKPEYIWQPVGTIHKYNLVPLFIGSLKTTLVALVFAVPLGLAAALFVSQLASPRLKEWIKPAIELLAAIPSVVLGAFAMLVLATLLQRMFGLPSRLNALLAGIALGITSIPVIFSIAEDALTSVPRSYSQAALALGASKWRTAWEVVLPAALPGVFAAMVLGFGRCLGETMVVLLASGNASIMSWSVFDAVRTVTATIAAEMGETVVGGHHYRMLFLLGAILFLLTFLTNMAADLVIHRFKARWEGRR